MTSPQDMSENIGSLLKNAANLTFLHAFSFWNNFGVSDLHIWKKVYPKSRTLSTLHDTVFCKSQRHRQWCYLPCVWLRWVSLKDAFFFFHFLENTSKVVVSSFTLWNVCSKAYVHTYGSALPPLSASSQFISFAMTPHYGAIVLVLIE